MNKNFQDIVNYFSPELNNKDVNDIIKKYFEVDYEEFINNFYNNNRSLFFKKADLIKYSSNHFTANTKERKLNSITDFIIFANKVDFTEPLLKLEFIDENLLPRINESLKQQLSDMLMRFTYRTIIMDINIKRKNGILKEVNDKKQFDEYLNLIEQKDFLEEFIQNYNQLITLLEELLYQLNNNILLFLYNLKKDEHLLMTSFEKKNKYLKSLTLAMGDLHNDGSMVIKCEYDQQSIYYKPRQGGIDDFYSQLIQQCNNDLSLNLKNPQNLIFEQYYWSEEIKYNICNNKNEVENFYYELGFHLCLLYLLGATDFHSENLIADGQHPVLIDLETVIGVRFKNDIFNNATSYNKFLHSTSVKSIGILPFIFGNNRSSDISGIGRKGETQSSIKVPQVKNPGTSNIRVGSDYIELGESKNHPKLGDDFVDEKNYKENLKSGFSDAYDYIMKNDEKLYSILLKNSANIKIRFINKPTLFYSNILNLSHHPIISQNMALREFFIASQLYKNSDDLTRFELSDLVRNNVPYFTFKLNDNSIFHHREGTKTDFFKKQPIESIRQRLNIFSQLDKRYQLEIIDQSLFDDKYTISPKEKEYSIKNYQDIKNKNLLGNSKQKFENIIIAIENIIRERQIKIDNTYSWSTGLLYGDLGKRNFQYLVMNENLYDGLSGMAFYYYCMYLYFDNSTFLEKTKNLTVDVEHSISSDNLPIGAFDGVFSYVYLCSLLYKETGDRDYLTKCFMTIERVENKIENDKLNDFISGNAGVLTILINLYKVCDYQEDRRFLYKFIMLCVTTLLRNRIQIDSGKVTWNFVNNQRITGFAHGNSGVSFALKKFLKIVEFSDDVQRVVESADSFEEDHRIDNYWPHHNHEESLPPFAWCHGSPGILINRKESKSKISDNKLLIDEIFTQGFSRTHCLCHGDLGNAVILKNIDYADNDKISQVIYDIFKDKEIEDIKCGIGSDIQTLELMTGLSGISYGLMYILKDNLPNLLELEI